MRPRDVLARNLEKLMAATPGLSTFPQITAAGGGSNGTLDRIRRKQINTGVDNLAALAAAYGLQPWELLVPTLAPERGSEVRPVIKGSPVWPFASIAASRFMALPDSVRAEIERDLLALIEKSEAKPALVNGGQTGSQKPQKASGKLSRSSLGAASRKTA